LVKSLYSLMHDNSKHLRMLCCGAFTHTHTHTHTLVQEFTQAFLYCTNCIFYPLTEITENFQYFYIFNISVFCMCFFNYEDSGNVLVN